MMTNSKIRLLDDRFERLMDSVLLSVEDSELTPQKRAMRRTAVENDALNFCKVYFPQIFYRKFNRLHKHMASIDRGMWTYSGFRRCGKSAFAYIGKGIRGIVTRNLKGIFNVNAATLDIANERTAQLKRLILENRLLCYDYDIEVQQDLKGWYIINGIHMIAGSVKTGLRNLIDDRFRRVALAINDDLYNKDNVTSALHCQKVVDFIEYEVRGQLEDDGLSLTLGNSISPSAPVVTLKENHPDHHFGLPALDAKGRSTWPQLRTAKQWQTFRQQENIPYDVWQGDYMDKPGLKGDIFDLDWLRGVNINTRTIIASISSLDASYGQSPSACFKAIATLSLTDKHEIICTDIYIRKESYDRVFDYVDALSERIPFWKVLTFENDFNQFAIAQPYYIDWQVKRKKSLPIVMNLASELATQYRGADKESRILNLVHPHQTGMFFYSDDCMKTADFEKYKAQYMAYGKDKTKLDGLDAMATAYILIWCFTETGGFKPIKKRVFEKLRWFRS